MRRFHDSRRLLLVADNVYISYGELRRNSETVGRENTDESVVDTAKWGNMRIATKWWVEVMKVVGEGVGQSTALVGLLVLRAASLPRDLPAST
jgi:hypothetical protein